MIRWGSSLEINIFIPLAPTSVRANSLRSANEVSKQYPVNERETYVLINPPEPE